MRQPFLQVLALIMLAPLAAAQWSDQLLSKKETAQVSAIFIMAGVEVAECPGEVTEASEGDPDLLYTAVPGGITATDIEKVVY